MSDAAAEKRITQTYYDDDPLLRVSRIIPPGHTTSNAVDTRYGYWSDEPGLGRSFQAVKDEKGIRTASVHDPYGRMVYTIADSAGTAATRNNKTSFAYDTLDRITSSVMPGGGKTTYTYDTLGRMTSKRYPDADGPVRYKYDDLGRARFSQDARQRAAGTGKVTFTIYDDFGRVTSVGEAAADFSALDPERSYAFERDSVSWRSRVNRLIYPDGSQARYAYDGAGRLSRVRDARGATLAAYTHTAAGNMERHVVGDGIATGTFTYNLREWVTEIDYPGKFNVEQSYDAVGNVTSQRYHRAASESPKAAAYSYDRLHRLTAFNLTGGQRQYNRYDRRGNLVEMLTNGSYIYYRYENSSAPNRVSFVYGGGLFIRAAYNPNGWMTRMTRNALTYDYRGLLTGHGSAAYTMDPDRRRVKKTVGTAVTYYLRGADGSVLAEYDGGQALTARYVYAGGRRIARVAGSGTSYYLADHLGSTRSLIDEVGDVTAAYDYWPYGKVLASGGTESTHFRFTGHERDAESRLDYMLERSYAYDMGRFLRPDPMQDKYPGISPYAYAANNPLKYVDPDGNSHHEPQDQYDANQIVQDRFDEGGVEVANAIANLPGYVKSGAERGAEAFVDYSLDFAETSVESGIVISDALSDGSIAGAVAGTAGVAVGIATRNPALAAGSVKFTYTMLSVNTSANVASTVLKGVDAAAFDGSWEAAYTQTAMTILGGGGSQIAGRIGSRFVAATGSSVSNTMYRSSASGQFLSNRVGFTTTAAVDATRIGINISLDSLPGR